MRMYTVLFIHTNIQHLDRYYSVLLKDKFLTNIRALFAFIKLIGQMRS